MKKLNWTTKFDTQFSNEADFLSTLLNAYGIEDVNSFIHPIKNQVLNNPFLMKNMNEAVELIKKNINKKIIIKVDCD